MKLLHFHKKFPTVAVIQIIPLEIVKLEEKAVPEVDKYRSNRKQKTNKAPHTSASPEKNINITLHTTDIILETSEQITHPEKTLTKNKATNEVVLLEGENLMYIPLKFENKIRRRALIDRRACANAMPADFYKKLKEESPISISELQQASILNVNVASGRTVKVLAQVDVKFKFNDHNFQDSFLILPLMNSVVLGNPFFKKI